MMRAMARLADGSLRSDLPLADLAALRNDPGVMLWVDLMPDRADEEETERLLLEQFQFHPLAVDDALRETHVPKVDDWCDYLYIVLHAVQFEPATRRVRTPELDIFVGRHYLVTYHVEPIRELETIWAAVVREPRRLAEGTDNLLYQIVDSIVAEYMPLVDQLDEWIDEIENEMFAQPTPQTLARILRQKRRLVGLRRSLAALREVLNKLARDEFGVIDPRDRIYFRDVYDHVVRLYEIVESMRDLVGGALDTYLSISSNRTNEIVKTLTLVSVIFLPISFLAGFFGMNFFGADIDVHPNLDARTLFWSILAMMLAGPPSIYAWIRLRKWA